jgi:EAL domain-containing protein (putative c-di-GMP-specific phosphodiesterase class I)
MYNSGDRREPTGAAVNQLNEASEAGLLLQRDLREAWAERQFDLAYQPQFNLFTHSVVSFEALLRWHHAVRGNVPPVEFIPVAEEAGLIGEIGQWVLEKACREATNWPDHIRVAVNLSAIQLRNATLPAIVAEALHSSGLSPSRLELEITESSVIPADTSCLAALHSIRSTGIRIVLDDFDIGYSALGYLVNFPFDKIKIDCFFTARLAKGADGHDTARAIVRAIIGLCKDLNITPLAEGVETLEQLMFLRDNHCTEIQGYLCGCPQPAAAIPGTLEKAPGLLREMSERGATSFGPTAEPLMNIDWLAEPFR